MLGEINLKILQKLTIVILAVCMFIPHLTVSAKLLQILLNFSKVLPLTITLSIYIKKLTIFF